ncbi:universal stress protein [Evansella sp. AB-P1]|uniref:universal stress protein n=1 Tax=Evansella sp. AB-P1 TaxID=3037653 RepID=UPI00241D2D04|nr:universal stress protein [Evansella sp. AB-P1]MDG5789508.1 universal stress protein [Evansella sp. AB-P1]
MIIVPIDGSTHALKALEFAISMANQYEEKLLLLNVQQKNGPHYAKEVIGKNEKRNKEVEGLHLLRDAIEQIDGKVSYDTKVRIGIPSIEISNEAKESKARCIIMGSRGNGPVVSAILGSVSYGVLHLSPCPVTVVPNK